MQTLDVALGLVFVYLMLSLACTAANEFLSQWFNSRATTLRQGIDTLLSNQEKAITPDSVVALHAAHKAAKANLETAEHALRAATPQGYEAWVAADRSATDAALVYEQVCVRARAAQPRVAAPEQASSWTWQIPELDEQNPETPVGAARRRLDEANALRDAAALALPSSASEQLTALLKARKSAAEANAAHCLATLYRHPLIAGLSQLPWRLFSKKQRERLPSYIPTQTFVQALIDKIAPAASGSPTPLLEVRRVAAQLPEHVRRPLLLALNESAGDLDLFRAKLATWYDDTMERVSGLYKRKTKLTVLMFAVLITLFTNADTIRIVRAISSNKVLRETLVAQAQAATGPALSDSVRKSLALSIDDLQALGIPIGYVMPDSIARLLPKANWFSKTRAPATDVVGDTTTRAVPSRITLYRRVYVPQVVSGAMGLLLTALALSLGAPFWFDILNKIVNVRAVGRTPAENAKEKSKQARVT